LWILGRLLWTKELKVYILQTQTNQKFKTLAAFFSTYRKVSNSWNWGAFAEQLFAQDASVAA
jgi:hypothetical protein